MDVLEDAIYDFSEVLEFFEDWKSALGKTKDSELESESLDPYLFWMTLKRHVGIARKLMIDLYDCFDIYVIEKNRNPFVVKRPGKRSKKLRFGKRQYKVEVETKPNEICPIFEETTRKTFKKKELQVVNKLYNGTVKICRLQSFIDAVKNDPPSEKGDEIAVEVTTLSGGVARGILTYSPNGSSKKEIDQHLEVTNSCRNMCGIEMNFIGDVEFGLKLVVAKLKRMKNPYVTPIQNVVRLDDVEMAAEQISEQQVAVDVPPEGAIHEAAKAEPSDKKAIEMADTGMGDASFPDVGWKGMEVTSDPINEKFRSPFSEHPEPYDQSSDSDDEAPSTHPELPESIASVQIPVKNYVRRAISCTIQ